MSDYDIYLVARLLAGYPANDDQIAQMDGLQNVAQALMAAEDRLITFETVMATLDDADRLRQRIIAVDPAGPAPTGDAEPAAPWWDTALMPDLPKAARLSPEMIEAGAAAGRWLDIYTDYAYQRAPMLPRQFHETAGLYLLSLAIARRLTVRMPHDNVYPNLFILWIAQTTVYTKSTGLKVAKEIAEEAMPHLLLSNEFSPEGLLDDMAGKAPPNLDELPQNQRDAWHKSLKFGARRGLILDEASSLFASLKRDFNTGLAEALMRFYDCGNHIGRTRGRGMISVRDSYLSFLGATTEASLRQADIHSLWSSGLWPRFALIVPTERATFRRFQTIPERPPELVDHLQAISNEYLPTPVELADYPKPRSVSMQPQVFTAWQRYDEALVKDLLLSDTPPTDLLFGIYGRLPTQCLKIATLLAAADWDGEHNSPQIEIGHWARAQQIAEQWRASAHQLYYTLTGITEDDTIERRLINRVAKDGELGTTIRDLYRAERRKREEIEPIVIRLVREGLLEEYRPAGKRVDYFRLISYSQ